MSTNPDGPGAMWRKSSHSNGAVNCVEIAFLADGTIGVRHSRRPAGPVLVYTRDEWQAFVEGVKGLEFDL